ncbi:hypothetical protein [Streptomyces sp. NPDC000229]|uniref:hypothetical protein n=1 Tax=Streptomyces sp. NPDC000229 TaxID=3154247 RepID=UPI0033175F46
MIERSGTSVVRAGRAALGGGVAAPAGERPRPVPTVRPVARRSGRLRATSSLKENPCTARSSSPTTSRPGRAA